MTSVEHKKALGR